MIIARPNAWVSVEDDPAPQLTYAPSVDPAPLTVSVPGRDPTLGALVVVMTNGTPADIAVSSVTLTIVVGQPGVEGPPLTPTTEEVKTIVSDTTTWSFTAPSSPVTSGTADYVLTPASGDTATLAAGASVYVEIYDFQTVEAASTSTVTVAEVVDGGESAFADIAVSTFPDGFFFDGLAVNVRSGNALVPVAQVVSGTGVTLTWNSSVADTKNQTVYWSSPTSGQQQATPAKLGEWSTPQDQPLTSDTVFVVVVAAQDVGGEEMTASLATAVSVQDPALVASTVKTGGLTVTGDETVAGTLTANGALAANGGLTAVAAAVSGSLDARQAKVSLLSGVVAVPVNGTYLANTDGLVVGSASYQYGQMYGPAGYLRGSSGQTWAMAWANSGTSQSSSFVLPVAAGQQYTLATTVADPGDPSNILIFDAWWTPLGTAPPGTPAFERVGDAPPVDAEIAEAMAGAAARHERAPLEFADLLEEIVGKPIDEDMRRRLAAALRGV
ncbi:MAG: hypothetical protein M3340_01465 [Actinomycetota bacterium]|nr:hypothetical protein [Actinomycetota bacterium]